MEDLSEITQEQIEERINSLPESLQETLSSERVRDIVRRIGHAYELDDDNLKTLEQAAAFVFLGLIPLGDLANYMNDVLGLDDFTTAKNIASDLNARVFYSIRDQLERVAQDSGETSESEAGELSPEVSQAAPVPEAKPFFSDALSQPAMSDIQPAAVSPTLLSAPPSAPAPAEAAPEVAKPEDAAPIFLHQETELRPVELEKNFSFPSGGFASENMGGRSGGELPPRAATIELGNSTDEALKSLFVKKEELPNATMINYNQFTPKAPLSEPPGPSSGPMSLDNLPLPIPASSSNSFKNSEPPAPITSPSAPTPEPFSIDLPEAAPSESTPTSGASRMPEKKSFLNKIVKKITGSPSPDIPSGPVKMVNYSADSLPPSPGPTVNLNAPMPIPEDLPIKPTEEASPSAPLPPGAA